VSIAIYLQCNVGLTAVSESPKLNGIMQ